MGVRWTCLLVSLLLLAAPPALRAEDPPRQPGAGVLADVPGKVRGWIQDLRSDDYEVRERARTALEKWGAEAPDVLLEHQDDPDAEVRRTVRGLLARIGGGAKAVPVAPEPDDPDEAMELAISTPMPLGTCLEALTGQMPAFRVVAPAEALAREVTVRVTGGLWDVLDALAEAADLDLPPEGFDAEGQLTLAPAARAAGAQAVERVPTGFSGPLRVRATRVEVVRPLGAPGPARHGLGFDVQLTPDVRLVSYRAPRVTRAEDGVGRRWRAVPGRDMNTTVGVGAEARRVDVVATLERQDADADERLARLDLEIEARLRRLPRSVRFATLEGLPRTLGKGGSPAEPAAAESVTLESVEPAEGRAGAWSVALACTLASPVARASVEAWLELEGGVARRLWVVGGRSSDSADGRVRLVGRLYNAGSAKPVAVHVVWFERETARAFPVTLTDVPLR